MATLHRYRLDIRGGFVLATWASLGILVLALLLYIIFSWMLLWTFAALGCIACFIGFPWSYRHRDITVGRTELRVHAGRSFRMVRRLPRRYLTGCTVFASPLQRILGICTLVLYTPGAFVVLPGMKKADGELLAQGLMEDAV